MFDIKIKNCSTGVESDLRYDKQSNIFLTEEDENFIANYRTYVYPEESLIKGRVLYVVPGFACNRSCSYCCQKHTGKEDITEEHIERVVSEILEVKQEISTILFIGGEPLIYFDEMQEVVKRLEAANFRGEHTRYAIITNGTLLNKDNMNWMCDNDFIVSISHDGPTQRFRGYDILDNENILYYIRQMLNTEDGSTRLQINSVLTAGNIEQDYRQKWFSEKIGMEVPSGILSGEGFAMEDTYFNNVSLDIHDRFYKDLRDGNGMDYMYYFTTIRELKKLFINGIYVDKPDNYCTAGDDLNFHIYREEESSPTAHCLPEDFDYSNASDLEECKNCPFTTSCRGGCPRLVRDGKVIDSNCRVYKESHGALFKMAFHLATEREYEIVDIKFNGKDCIFE